MPINSVGTTSTPNPASTNTRTRQRRASATQAAGLDVTAEWRNATRSGITLTDGFFAVWRFSTGTALAGQRIFVGYTQSTSNIGTGVNPTAFTDCIGMGHDDLGGAGNYSIIHNDNAGAATTIALGANFPKNDTAVYELVLFVPQGGAEINYQVTNLETGDVATGTIVADLPDITGSNQSHIWINSGTTNGAPIIDCERHHYEVPRYGDVL
jgi:hypothetical protein